MVLRRPVSGVLTPGAEPPMRCGGKCGKLAEKPFFMRILLKKISNDRHLLEIIRADGSRDGAELETKSLLAHDFTHLAVEGEAGLQSGFWGALAAGKTMADMNDRTGAGSAEYAGSLAVIELLVGALQGAPEDGEPGAIVARIRGYLAALGTPDASSEWLTPELVAGVRERLRKLVGQWKGTLFGQVMEVVWDERESSARMR